MSGENMQYPETWEEFIEKYSFTDYLKEYTNESELIPIFRVGQMVEHYFENMESGKIEANE